MSPAVMHAGWCDGGPLAGRQLAHDTPRYRVPILRAVTAPLNGETKVDGEYVAVVEGEYVWDDGAWRWKE